MSSSICSGRLRAALQAPAQNDFDAMLGCKETRVALVSKRKGKTSGEPATRRHLGKRRRRDWRGPDPNEHLLQTDSTAAEDSTAADAPLVTSHRHPSLRGHCSRRPGQRATRPCACVLLRLHCCSSRHHQKTVNRLSCPSRRSRTTPLCIFIYILESSTNNSLFDTIFDNQTLQSVHSKLPPLHP